MPVLSTDPVCLAVDSDGEIEVPLRFAVGVDGVRLRIRYRILLVVGEWFLDLEAGMRWLPGGAVADGDSILGNPFDRVRLLADMRAQITAVDGVAQVLALDATEAERAVAVSSTVRTSFGDTVDVQVEVPQ